MDLAARQCTHCRLDHPLSSFAKASKTKDGLQPWCRSCTKENASRPEAQARRKASYEANKERWLGMSRERWKTKKEVYEPARRKWAEDNRDKMIAYYNDKGRDYREFLDATKAGKPCLDCIQSFPPHVMEYDHVRGEKRFALGKMTNHRRDRVLEEIGKCELVCCVCHRIRSQERRAPSKTPGVTAFRAWLAPLKAAPCLDCGGCFPPEAMDLDHVCGEKLSDITNMWSWKRSRVLEEIAKCELVCANCHRIRTVARLREPDVA